MQGRWRVQVAANSPKTAHTWKRRTSAMSPVRYCGGTPHRTVQNQVVCRTGRPRRTVRYRKRPCGVREVHLSAGAARGGGSSAGRHVERMTGVSGNRWRIVVAQVRRKSMMARLRQSRCDTKPDSAGGRQVSDNKRNNDLSCLVLLTGKMLFCLIISVLSATGRAPRCVAAVRNVCLAARTLSPLPHAVDSNIRPPKTIRRTI